MPEVNPLGRRERKALDTRRRIRGAAQRLFVQRGYVATTIQQIALEADVAVQTVYAVFGTKAAILSEVFDVTVGGDDDPVPVAERPFVRAIAAAPDAKQKARLLAAHFREATSRSAAVQHVIEAAAATDPDMAALWDKLLGQLLGGMTGAARALHAQGAIRPDLTVEQAADLLWWYAGPWAFHGLVTTRGWDLDQYETWVAESLYHQVMTPHPADLP